MEGCESRVWSVFGGVWRRGGFPIELLRDKLSKTISLLAIKKAADLWKVFWARIAVGSEALSVRSTDPIEDENGRLCWT